MLRAVSTGVDGSGAEVAGQGRANRAAERVSRLLHGWAWLTACAAVATAGMHALGNLEPAWLPTDLVTALGAPAWLWLAYRQRETLLREPLLRAWLAVVLAWLVTSAVHVASSPAAFAGNLARGLQACVAVVGFAAVARRAAWASLLRAWLWGFAACLAVAYLGYIGALLGEHGLAKVGPHPVFAQWPRMVGTFGDSPQHFGEYVLVSLGVAHAVRPPGALATWLKCAGWLALLLTFSTAWVGGACLLLGLWPAEKLPTGPRVVAAVVVALAATWLVTFSLPTEQARRGTIQSLDVEHSIVRCAAGACEEQLREWPYRAQLTPYRLAKEQSLEAGVEHFPWGLGPGRFRSFADARARAGWGVIVAYYRAPHSTYLGAFAEQGLPGLLALAYLVIALLTWRETTPGMGALWLSVLGLLLVGMNIDVLRQRHLWLALGLLAGARTGAVRGV